jgi:predicted O-methyltransferase YrrM
LYRRLKEASLPLAKAINALWENELTPEERVWIDKIQSLRDKLSSSEAQVSFVSYAVGKADDPVSEEVMNQGRTETQSIRWLCKSASGSHLYTLLLFKIIREFKLNTCLELGTCLGISASYQAAALKVNGQGILTTLEGAEALARLSEENFAELGLDNVNVIVGRCEDTLDKTINDIKPIDYVFIDARHDEKANLEYFEQIIPGVSGKSVLVFDDIAWSKGMRRAWKTISSDKRINLVLDMRRIGLCIIDNEIKQKRYFKVELF